MNYEVVWTPAEDDIEKVLNEAPDKKAVVRAILRLDAALGYCPERTCESRDSDERIAFERPIIATVTVDEREQRVHVLRLRYHEPPDLI